MKRALSCEMTVFHRIALGLTLVGLLVSGAQAQGEEKIVTTSSGLKYVDIVEGQGDVPAAGDKITMHYVGTLENGQKFDSSYDRKKPFTFTHEVTSLIPGWTEGVSTMKVGGKRKLIVPSRLGYGLDGVPPLIPPNATLIFEMEVLKIEKLR
jgi:FKBP-type peptidyl-prolyl cis-trans isomerase